MMILFMIFLIVLVACVLCFLKLEPEEIQNPESDETEITFEIKEADDSDLKPEAEIKQENAEMKPVDLCDTDELLKLKNKEFIFRCLDILKVKEKREDIEKLTDSDFCKDNFDMNYPILRYCDLSSYSERIFFDKKGNRRYYPNIVMLFGKNYIVSNDWYYNNNINTRDTRTRFVRWVMR